MASFGQACGIATQSQLHLSYRIHRKAYPMQLHFCAGAQQVVELMEADRARNQQPQAQAQAQRQPSASRTALPSVSSFSKCASTVRSAAFFSRASNPV